MFLVFKNTAGTMAAAAFPRFVIIKPYGMEHSCWGYAEEYKGIPDSVILESEQGMHNPHAKIEVEPAKSDGRYFHLRFCNANKYISWGYNEGDDCLVASSGEPQENRAYKSCTLFEPVKADGDDGYMYLVHVLTGRRAQYDGGDAGHIKIDGDSSEDWDKVRFVDWESIVKLPEHVAFKNDKGKYLQVIEQGGHPYLKFSSDDPYDEASGFRVYNREDGYVRIKSDYNGMFWKPSPDWICAEESGAGSYDRFEDAFWPTKIDEKTIVLQNGAENKYLKPDSDWLKAAATTATKDARMVVEELVQERKIYRVIYRTDEARIYDKTAFVAGKTTATNRGDEEASMEVEVTYEEERSTSFNRSLSLTAGVTTSIEAGVPGILSGKVEVRYEISGTLEWGSTTTTKTSVTSKGIVRVPAKSMAVVHYTGVMASCDVPYSYVQQDKSSTDGKIVYTMLNDGVFTGVNSYDFDFIVDKAHPL